MKRRQFITLLGGAVVAWPLAARAQQTALPAIGFLSSETPSGYGFRAAAFRQGLSEAGYVEGRNVAIEYRWAQGNNDRLPALAAELVRHPVAVIIAAGTASTLAAMAATTTIPIVFSMAADPVAEGLVANLARPGGNATGVNNLSAELVQKEMEKLHQMVPTATGIAALVNPTNPTLAEPAAKEAQAAGRTLGLKIHIIQASTERDIAGPAGRLGAVDLGIADATMPNSASSAHIRGTHVPVEEPSTAAGDNIIPNKEEPLAGIARGQGLPTASPELRGQTGR
jgi:ABC-type uncharacterized transport system substrate-binding protein